MALFKNFHGFLVDLNQVICVEPAGNFQTTSDASWKYGFKVHLAGGNSIAVIKPKPIKDALYCDADYLQATTELRDKFVQLLKDNGIVE